MWEVVIGMCVVFKVDVCYLIKLKLASGNACNCNDRSGMSFKENMYFFNIILFKKKNNKEASADMK